MSGTAGKKGKKSAKTQLLEEGLEKTDNNLGLTSWPVIDSTINPKNCYTEYLKRNDQYLANRISLQETTNKLVREARNKDRALAQNNDGTGSNNTAAADEDAIMEDVGDLPLGSKTIVIHPGSQFLRIGFANAAIPKTVPMVIARRSEQSEAEENGGEPLPKRVKIDGETPFEPEKLWGEKWAAQYKELSAKVKVSHVARKVLTLNWNRRQDPSLVSEHNDSDRIDWTEVSSRNPPAFITGHAALRIPEKSTPRYKLFWPLKHGCLNEKAYSQSNLMFADYFQIIEQAIKVEVGVPRRDWPQHSCVFVIPDLYERTPFITILDETLRYFGFARVCFIQESVAATFGSGLPIACVVDVGAQKTSICCVDDGMCVEDSRMNLKYGGYDITETFIKMALHDYFPYTDINLNRRHDFLLAEELKQKHCHLDTILFNILKHPKYSIDAFSFKVRAAGQDTQEYFVRHYDDVYLAPYTLFYPDILDFAHKLDGRRSILSRSYDIFDGLPNETTSLAQTSALAYASEHYPSCRQQSPDQNDTKSSFSYNILSRLNEVVNTPRSSAAASPAPEATTKRENNNNTAANDNATTNEEIAASSSTAVDPVIERIRAAEASDRVLPIMPLHTAIQQSIRQATTTKGVTDERKMREFLGCILVVGGGAKISEFNAMLEEKLKLDMPEHAKSILVSMPARELDQEVVVWKGASVFGRLSTTGNDSWVYQMEYELLGSKMLSQTQKMMWLF